MTNKPLGLVFLIAIAAFTWEFITLIIYLSTNVLIFWQIASILISVATIIIRLFVIDSEKFVSLIKKTDTYSTNVSLKPKRFLNLMPIAMVTCTIADIVIPISFIAGMLSFLVAQILFVIAYSGIIHINPKLAYSGENKILALGSTITLLIIVILIYTLLIYSAEDITTLLVIPYIAILTFMVIITYISLGYKSRSFKFRLNLCIGATLFLISDAILAYNRFNTSIYRAHLLIGSTYFLAIFMLQYAILFMRSQK